MYSICPIPLTPPKQQRKILGQFLMEPSCLLLRASGIASVQQWEQTTVEPDKKPSSVVEKC